MSDTMIALGVGGTAGLIVGLVFRILANRPLRQLRRACKDVQRIVRQRIPAAEVFIRGGKNVHPVFWVKIPRDVERDQLRAEATLTEEFRAALVQTGYPTIDVPLAQLVFESEETVERDYSGSWSKRQYDWSMRRYH